MYFVVVVVVVFRGGGGGGEWGGKREAAILGRKVTNFPGQIEATKDEREAMEKRREQPFYRQNKRNKAGN